MGHLPNKSGHCDFDIHTTVLSKSPQNPKSYKFIHLDIVDAVLDSVGNRSA